jgi:hypothetical protein
MSLNQRRRSDTPAIAHLQLLGCTAFGQLCLSEPVITSCPDIMPVRKPVLSKLQESSRMPYFAFTLRIRSNHSLITSGSFHRALWRSYFGLMAEIARDILSS